MYDDTWEAKDCVNLLITSDWQELYRAIITTKTRQRRCLPYNIRSRLVNEGDEAVGVRITRTMRCNQPSLATFIQ